MVVFLLGAVGVGWARGEAENPHRMQHRMFVASGQSWVQWHFSLRVVLLLQRGAVWWRKIIMLVVRKWHVRVPPMTMRMTITMIMIMIMAMAMVMAMTMVEVMRKRAR